VTVFQVAQEVQRTAASMITSGRSTGPMIDDPDTQEILKAN